MNQNDINLVGDYSNFMEEYIDADLEHYGVPKMRWHHRRWQYPDGSLTPAGRDHYGVGPPRAVDPEHPITSRMAKAAQGFKERRAIAKIYAEKEARDKRLQDGKKAAKLKREQRAKEVKEMTRTPDDLVKNRDKLTEEEFNAAVEKFEKLKQIDTDNQALLKRYNGLKDDSPKELDDDEYEDYDGDPWLAGQHWTHPPRKYQNPDGTLTEEGKDKFLNNGRAEKVAKWTKTAEDLVKNRDKLTDEEFQDAVLRFDRERTKKLENEAILRAFGGGDSYEARKQARSAEKISEAYRKYNAKELLKHKGEFTKEEFDQLKVLIASKSTSDLKKLTTYLSADEYQTALNRYAKTEGARKGQVVQDLSNAGKNVKSVVDMIDQGYKVMDTASKLTTGRSIQDLAKNATGTAFMSLIEKADLDTALNRAKAAEAASDSAKAVVGGVKNVMERAKNMTDKEYAEAMSPYYDSVMDILTGNANDKNGKGKNKNKNNPNDQNSNPQPNPQQQNAGQTKQDKKKGQQTSTTSNNKDDELSKSFEDFDIRKPTIDFGSKKTIDAPTLKFDEPEPTKKEQKKQNNTTTTVDPYAGLSPNKSSIYPDVSTKDKRNKKVTESLWDIAPSASAPTLSFDTPSKTKPKKDEELAKSFEGMDDIKRPTIYTNGFSKKTPTLSFDTPSQSTSKKEQTKTSNDNQSYYVPKLTFGEDSVSMPNVKPMTQSEYNAVMKKLSNDVADFVQMTSGANANNFMLSDKDVEDIIRSLRR